MTSTKILNSELYDRLHPISRPIKTTNTNPCSFTNQIGQLRYHHIPHCHHYNHLLNVHHCHRHPHPGHHDPVPDPGLEQPGHRHHTILFICHLSESIYMYFLQACMLWVKSRKAALFHIASTKLAFLILYYSTLWHGDITFCQVDHDLPLEHTSVETLDI